MIWSVSTLLPNFQARPRKTLGSVTVAFPRRPALPGDRPVTTKAKTMGARGGVSAGGACPRYAFSKRDRERPWAAARFVARLDSREASRLRRVRAEHHHVRR